MMWWKFEYKDLKIITDKTSPLLVYTMDDKAKYKGTYINDVIQIKTKWKNRLMYELIQSVRVI